MPRLSRPRRIAGLLIAAGATVAACDTDDGRTLDPPVFPPPATTLPPATLPVEGAGDAGATDAPAELQLVTPWRDGAAIPTRHTCDGENLSPALTWANVPPGTVEVAVTVTDLQAPDFVHWVVYGIRPEATGTVEGEPPDDSFLWPNSGGSGDYAGPCPPDGEEHRYFFTVHALNQQLELADGMTAAEVVELLNITSIDQSSVSGVYARGG